ncbi:hypothetical protein [Eubacterium ramulus]|uniref:hypothetical protein n=1 Tax=Eubacterium ramulus TaxID=39490 RepID=UPI00351F848E
MDYPKTVTGVYRSMPPVVMFHPQRGTAVRLPVCHGALPATIFRIIKTTITCQRNIRSSTKVIGTVCRFSDHRQKATPENCYLPKKGMFLAGNKKSDFFRFQQDRKDKTYYMDLSDLLDVDQKILSADITPALQEELQLLIAERLKKFKPML